MYIVTGGAGFIGSNIVASLSEAGGSDIVVVDNLNSPEKLDNLSRNRITDYYQKDDFLLHLSRSPRRFSSARAIIHQGACSNTGETNLEYLMKNNFAYSRTLLLFCLEHHIPLIYASSAAVYGGTLTPFTARNARVGSLTGYAFSKALFDSFVLSHIGNAGSLVVGLRYFNVYGPGEAHKGTMASVVRQFYLQCTQTGRIRLFRNETSDAPYSRDFIYVSDVVRVVMYFLEHQMSGIFDVGTGCSQSFEVVAQLVTDYVGHGAIDLIEMPANLRRYYQGYTRADTSLLSSVGFSLPPLSIQDGIKRYLDDLQQTG